VLTWLLRLILIPSGVVAGWFVARDPAEFRHRAGDGGAVSDRVRGCGDRVDAGWRGGTTLVAIAGLQRPEPLPPGQLHNQSPKGRFRNKKLCLHNMSNIALDPSFGRNEPQKRHGTVRPRVTSHRC